MIATTKKINAQLSMTALRGADTGCRHNQFCK